MTDNIIIQFRQSSDHERIMYEMTGGTFDEMKDEIKALGGKFFSGIDIKRWGLSVKAINELNKTYTLKLIPLLRVNVNEPSMTQTLTPYTEYLTVTFDHRIGGDGGRWSFLNGFSLKFKVEIDADLMEAARQRIIRDIEEMNATHGTDVRTDNIGDYQAHRRICREAIEIRGTEAIAWFNRELGGDYSTANVKATLDRFYDYLKGKVAA